MKKIIVAIAIVFAFTLGTVFSADIATAVKPVTEVLVTNTEPIPVTGIVASSTQASTLVVEGSAIPDGCTSAQTSGIISFSWVGLPTQFVTNNFGTTGKITQVEVTETSFVAEGYYKNTAPGCVSATNNDVPNEITITGGCGIGVPVEITTLGGHMASGTANVVCIP